MQSMLAWASTASHPDNLSLIKVIDHYQPHLSTFACTALTKDRSTAKGLTEEDKERERKMGREERTVK